MITRDDILNARILIVDDREANVEVLEDFLDLEGYTDFKSTTDSRLVLDLFREYKPDLILLDLRMPNLSGFDVMNQLRENTPEGTFLPILVVTADITKEAKERALSSGAKDFLTKPYEMSEVFLRINNLLMTSLLVKETLNYSATLEKKVEKRTAQLKQTNDQLEVAIKHAEAVDKFRTSIMQNISHEIRTPLNGILGFAEILINGDVDMDDKESFMPMLRTSADRLLSTVTDYVDISLLQSETMKFSPRTIIPFELVSEVINKYREMADGKAVELMLKLHNCHKDQTLITDMDMFPKVISHLVCNAVKFTPAGTISVDLYCTNTDYVVKVSDTGIGIDKDALEHIFKSFEQEDKAAYHPFEGTGLGLTIVDGLLRMMKGTIEVESEKGKGSVFTVTVPLVLDGN